MPLKPHSEALYLGLDLGTSGCRASVIDSQGQQQSFLKQPWPAALEQQAEQDPLIWWHTVQQLLYDLFKQINPQRIRAIAVDGTSSTLLLSALDGTPLTPALMYHHSENATAAQLIHQYAPKNSAAHGTSSSLAKLLTLQSRIPHRAFKALHQADWIAAKLSGNISYSDENNALKLGYDPITGCWPEWLKQLPIELQTLPKITPVGTVIGTAKIEITKQFGLHPSTQIISGTTDSIAAFIASGAHKIGEAVTSLGSTTVLKIISPQPIFSPKHGIYSHRLGDFWLAGGASNSGAGVLKQFFSDDELIRLSQNMDLSKPSGLHYYPLPSKGERFPLADPDLMPQLSPRPDNPQHFLQAILEGLSRIETQGYRLLAQLGAPYPHQIYSAGGGAINPAWQTLRERALH
ncbi:MAG: FGGY-family carbohydrate kinase, partial [Gammaproteobacteria bacterium]|nr:FGGY-family carbohydrate kinase [Gammaproteobacteria bacterium]